MSDRDKDILDSVERLSSQVEESFNRVAESLDGTIDKLIGPATNKNYISMESHQQSMDTVMKIVLPTIKALCTALVIIVIWVTGLKEYVPVILQKFMEVF